MVTAMRSTVRHLNGLAVDIAHSGVYKRRLKCQVLKRRPHTIL
jgi:hypothetical protein